MSWKIVLASTWTLVILALCWYPRAYMGVDEERGTFSIPHLDKLVHLGIFAIFAYLWMLAGSSNFRTRPIVASGGPLEAAATKGGRFHTAWRVVLAGVALAIISELGQEVPIVGRDANILDGLADALGVIVGVAAFGLTRMSVEKWAMRAGG